jgi:type VI secretion system protein ImpI
MELTLTIENEAALADGGPLTYTVKGKRGFEMGRDAHLDWTLPDPSRYISSKHCEVMYRDNAYWLHDLSTNGTYINGSDRRMSTPHRLRDGDRITIGQYLIAVALVGEPDVIEPPHHQELAIDAPRPSFHGDPWDDPLPPSSAPESGQRHFDDGRSWAPQMPRPSVAHTNAPSNFDIWDSHAAPQPQRDIPIDIPPPLPIPAAGLEPTLLDPSTPIPEPGRPAAQPPPMASAPGARSADDDRAFVRAFAAAAGIPEPVLDHHDSMSLAILLGDLMRLTVDDLRQLLVARFEAKRLSRSRNQTQIGSTANNPMKHTPTVDDALKLMFGRPTRSYLDAPRAMQESFADIKSHQLETYAAMQAALLELTDDFDPKKIESSIGRDSGLGNLVSSKKAKAWDIFVARWEAKTLRRDNGILGAYMEYFSKNYDLEK